MVGRNGRIWRKVRGTVTGRRFTSRTPSSAVARSTRYQAPRLTCRLVRTRVRAHCSACGMIALQRGEAGRVARGARAQFASLWGERLGRGSHCERSGVGARTGWVNPGLAPGVSETRPVLTNPAPRVEAEAALRPRQSQPKLKLPGGIRRQAAPGLTSLVDVECHAGRSCKPPRSRH